MTRKTTLSSIKVSMEKDDLGEWTEGSWRGERKGSRSGYQ
jgi:hypothetical protein